MVAVRIDTAFVDLFAIVVAPPFIGGNRCVADFLNGSPFTDGDTACGDCAAEIDTPHDAFAVLRLDLQD
ncbi:hypothetical protein LPH55_00520 [Xylella taiwanensis]|uniref:Uncharacterized protein n=1 Tax=Xylella taiwanensis TaxID=1444770 RepID=Z9JK61_9GAMM|nr:hypothetical protein [Xylella taiwanensis]AXI84336.1 hypothetical protein AB672_10535 [Xylella taiwanensis]EWS78137.1 hypothetical protein AF72_07410 [Xylella taiwanensis]MCD8471988.1 hypothetical protein [Xylella taiwanensis]UFN31924.1 hypothetical protein LPH63_01360 [Xylella taiwanensis]UFS54186.1 hypothetical protein LPH53_00335 [Xylella taiwanensis]